MIYLVESGSTDFCLLLEEKSSQTFDDLEVIIDGSKTHIQAKANDTGKLNALKKTLKFKTGEKMSSHRVMITHLNASEVRASFDIAEFGFNGFHLSNRLNHTLGFPKNFLECSILVTPQEQVIARENEEWFLGQHGDSGSRLYTETINEIHSAFRSSDVLAREFRKGRILRILRLTQRDANHFVHSANELIPRPDLVNQLIESMRTNKLTILLGEPGSGKSAILDMMCRSAKESTKLRVIRHSCFRSPTDPLPRLESRSVINELYYSGDFYQSTHRGGLNLPELVNKLKQASIFTVVVVDGVDHVMRDKPAELAEVGQVINALAGIDNIHLIVSAQVQDQLPGSVRASQEKSVLEMLPLTEKEVSEIVLLHGLKFQDDVINLLKEKSASNPLILSYLLKDLVSKNISSENTSQHLESLVRPAEVIEYLIRLLSTLSPEDRLVIRLLCYLEFGFDQLTFDHIAGEFGLSIFDYQALWQRIVHILRQIGPNRFLVWHYSLINALDKLERPPPTLDVSLMAAIDTISHTSDGILYSALMNLREDAPDVVKITSRLRAAVLDAQINPKQAEALIFRGCYQAANSGQISGLIQSAFKLEPGFSIVRKDYSSHPAQEAFGWAGSEKQSITTLFGRLDESVAELTLHLKGGVQHILQNAELLWLVDRTEFKSPSGFAVDLALNFFHGRISIEEVLGDIACSEWENDEEIPRPRPPRKKQQNRESRIETGYLLGRLLALNGASTALVSQSEILRSNKLTSQLLQVAMLGALEIPSEFSQNDIRNQLVEHWLTTNDSIPFRAIYQATFSGNRKAIDLCRAKLAEQDFSKLISNIEYSTFHEGLLFNQHKTLFSIFIAGGLGKTPSTSAILAQLETNPSLGKMAILDILRIILPNLDDLPGSLSSLISHIDATLPPYSTPRIWEYRNNAKAGITNLIEMGIIDSSQPEILTQLKELDSRMIRLDWIRLAQAQHDSPGLLKQAQESFDSLQTFYRNDPHQYYEQQANMAALYAVSGMGTEANSNAECSYRARHVYGYHKDNTYDFLLDLQKLAKSYLDPKYSHGFIGKVAQLLPLLDSITDGDHTRHWFAEIMELVFEDTKASESKLLLHAIHLAEKGKDIHAYWTRRLQYLLATELRHTDGEIHSSWVDIAEEWFFEGIPTGRDGERLDREFELWVIRGIRREKYWEKSPSGISFVLAIREWCQSFLERNKERIARGNTDHRRNPYFEDMVVATELLLGREPSYKPGYDEEDHEPHEQERFSDDEVSPENVKTLIREWYFWMPEWFSWGDKKKLQIIEILVAMGEEGLTLSLSAFCNRLREEHCSVYAAAYTLGLILGEFGRFEELKVVLDTALKEFDDYFPPLPKDEKFGEIVFSLSFVN